MIQSSTTEDEDALGYRVEHKIVNAVFHCGGDWEQLLNVGPSMYEGSIEFEIAAESVHLDRHRALALMSVLREMLGEEPA